MTTNQTIDGVPLLPCPFCGGEPYGTHDHYVHDDLSPMPCVECRACSAHLKAEDWNRRAEPAAQPQGEPVESSVFNDPLYNAESDARNASALLEEVLEWFDDGVGRSPAEFNLMRKIGAWLGRSVPSIDGGSDECAHSEANNIGCPECGEVFK